MLFFIKAMLYFIITYIIAGGIHELGHVIVALINGWKFQFLVIGPIRFEVDEADNRIKIHLEKNMMYWGGISYAIPVKLEEDNLKVWSKTLIGGPVTSIAFGIILIPLFLLTNSLFLLMLLAETIGIGIVCILPFPIRTGFLYSDGYRFWRLKHKGQSRLEESAIFATAMSSLYHDKNNNIDIKILLEPLINSNDVSYQYYAHYNLYNIAKNEAELDEMEKQRKNLEELKIKVAKNIIQAFPY